MSKGRRESPIPARSSQLKGATEGNTVRSPSEICAPSASWTVEGESRK